MVYEDKKLTPFVSQDEPETEGTEEPETAPEGEGDAQ